MSSIKEKGASLKNRFKLDSHHEIERFGVMIAALIGTLSLILVAMTASAWQNNSIVLGSKAIYTETFKTSKTGMQGKTAGVYVNDARTKAMILMEMSDPTKFSQDPNKYQAFVTSSTVEGNPVDLKNEFTGEIGIFGATGYMAVFLESPEPIVSDILSVTMRSTTQLVPSTDKEAAEAAEDRSFAEFDQWRVYVNPGASEAKVLPALNSDVIDMGNIYYETTLSGEEEIMRADLDKQLADMQIALAAIDEYETQLLSVSDNDGTKVVLQPAPEIIRGDEVVGSPMVPQPTATPSPGAEDADSGNEDEPQSEAMSGSTSMSGQSDDPLRLKADMVIPGGFDFDWRDGSIREGYINKLLGPDQTFSDFMADKAEEQKNSTVESVSSSSVNWALSNGKYLTDLKKDARTEPFFTQTNLLVQAWTNYYQMKVKYERTMLNDLLSLEYQYQSVVKNGALSNSDEAVLFY